MWDYYFEPVAYYSYSEITDFINDPAHPLTEKNLVHLDDDMLSYLHGGKPTSIYSYPNGYYTEVGKDFKSWYQAQRTKANALVNKYIRVKHHLMDEVASFAERHFGPRQVLGVHIRGTDKGCNSEAFHIARIIPPEKYFSHIDRYIEMNPDCVVFLATDQVQFQDTLKKRYGERVVTQSTLLSRNHINAFQEQDGNGYLKGKEVLLDALLLSRSNMLLKCASAVGEYAHYFNPELNSIDLNEYYGPLTFWEKCYRASIVEPYIFLRDFWRIEHKEYGGPLTFGQKCYRGSIIVPYMFLRNFGRIVLKGEKSERQKLTSLFTDFPLIRRFSDLLDSKQFSNNNIFRIMFFAKKYISLKLQKEKVPFQQVRQMAEHSKRRVGADYYSFRKARGKKYLEIRCDGEPQADFFAQYIHVLQQIRFAENHQLIPIVNLDHKYNYYFDESQNRNVWENYFEPVQGVSSSRLEKVPPKEITFISREQQSSLFIGDGKEPPLENNIKTKEWWQRQREMGARITEQYIRVRPEIQEVVERFYNTHFVNSRVLGLHHRGIEKSFSIYSASDERQLCLVRNIPQEEYFLMIDLFIEQNPDGKLFIVTDQKRFLTNVVAQYGDRVIPTEAIRYSMDKTVSADSGNGYQRGIEALTGALLLSKCNYLVKCFSNVGEGAIYFNPALPVIDLFYKYAPDEFKSFFQQGNN